MILSTNNAGLADLPFLCDVDGHVSSETLEKVVRLGRVMIAQADGDAVGFLRWGLFWDEFPFMNLLWVLPGRRRQGIASVLVEAWEAMHDQAGRTLVLTSTMSSEPAQHFYRRLGYVDTGALLLPDEPAELILRKHLS